MGLNPSRFDDEVNRAIRPRELRPVVTIPGSKRIKAKWQFFEKNQQLELGLYDLNHKAVVLDCPLHLPLVNEVAKAILHWMRTQGMKAYDLTTKKGELKSLTVIAYPGTQDLLIRLVARTKKYWPLYKQLADFLRQLFPTIKKILLSPEPAHKAVMQGPLDIPLFESMDDLQAIYGAIKISYSPRHFIQVNGEVATMLYKEASQVKATKLIDLYGGAGGFAAHMKAIEKVVVDIETWDRPPHFIKQDAFAFYVTEGKKFDTVVVNPPRRGLDKTLIDQLLIHRPDQLLYSSCHLESMKKDIEILSSLYEVEWARAFDLFPQTNHFETLAFLQKRINK